MVLFDNAPASVAISSGVVSFAAANLVTLTYSSALGYTHYRVKGTLFGTTTQEYAVMTINADDDTDAANKLSHTMTPDDSIGGPSIFPDVIEEGLSEDVITRIDIAVAASGTLPLADNGMIVIVEVW